MSFFPKKLSDRLAHRQSRHLLRVLPEAEDLTAKSLIDFSSNDYLGFSASEEISHRASQILAEEAPIKNGATGSRLLTGNHPLYSKLERKLAEFHESESALVFNSGYDANIGFFGCVPQRGDVVFYDEYIHASIRDGIGLGLAKSYKFKHNDLDDLKKKIGTWQKRNEKDADATSNTKAASATDTESVARPISQYNSEISKESEIYIVTESVFSMDGDSPDLNGLSEYCQNYGYHLIVDEAHAVGVFGEKGAGLVQQLGLQDVIFARIVTFGKSLGCHGAAILGSTSLKSYLINFARSLIYSTGLPPHSVATVLAAYEALLPSDLNNFEEDHLHLLTKQHPIKSEVHSELREYPSTPEKHPTPKKSNVADKEHYVSHTVVHPQITELREKISLFNQFVENRKLQEYFIPSTSTIHCCIIHGSERVRIVTEKIREAGFDAKAILSPTVPEGLERIRICIHTYNTEDEMDRLLSLLSEAIRNYGPRRNPN